MKYLVLDTETKATGSDPFAGMLAFEVGAVLWDSVTGETVRKEWLIADVPCKGTWSYGRNPSHYDNMTAKPLTVVKQELLEMVAEADKITAYNAKFDKEALENVGIEVEFTFCLQELNIATMWQTEEFQSWSKENDKRSKERGHGSKSAESAYRFIKKDASFNEEHTALADAEIELEILKALL